MNWRTWLKIGFSLLLVMALFACKQEITERETIVRDGVLYRIGEKEPFTGIVTGKGRDGYRRTVCTFEKAYEDGLQHGLTVYWYENGKVESKETYVHGEIHGYVTRYYPNGRPKARIPFEHGMRGGKGEMFWSPKGGRIKH